MLAGGSDLVLLASDLAAYFTGQPLWRLVQLPFLTAWITGRIFQMDDGNPL